MLEPVAVTENVTDVPVHFVELAGWLVIAGGVLIVRVAARDVTDGLQMPLTTTSYAPASVVATEEIV